MGGFAMTAGSRTWWASVYDLRTLAVDFRIHAMGRGVGQGEPRSDILGRMDDHEWARRLRAGIGGRRLGSLRHKTAIATAVDLLAVGNRDVPSAMAAANTGDATDAVGCCSEWPENYYLRQRD